MGLPNRSTSSGGCALTSLPLFALMNASPESSEVEMPPITKEKKAHVDRVMKDQARVDLARQYFPANVEPTEWLRVDAVVAGFGFGGKVPYESCNGTVINRNKPFYKKYVDFLDAEKWHRRNGADTYYSRQLIEAYSTHTGNPFDWSAALAVSPITDTPPQTKNRDDSRAIVQRLTPARPLGECVKRSFHDDSHLGRWLQFCEDYPGLQWFEINGEVLFPIPLVEQLKADNPGRDDLSYGGDYNSHFASSRIGFGRLHEKGVTQSLPPDIQAIAEMPGTKEVYQVKDCEHPDAWGFVLTGGRFTHGTAASEAHRQIGEPMRNRNIFHAVTFPLMYAYLVQGQSRIAKTAQYMGSRSMSDGIKADIDAKKETTPLADIAAGSAFVPALMSKIDTLQDLIIQGNKENKTEFNTLKAMMVNTQITLQGLSTANPSTYQESVDWLGKLRDIEASLLKLGNSTEETKRMLGEQLATKRNLVTGQVRDLHVRFVYTWYHGHCPVTNIKIVGEDPATNEICILRDSEGRPLGEVDHNFQVNQAGRLSTWLIEAKLNRRLANDIHERIRIQIEFGAYQKRLDEFDSPLLANIAS